jgi:hypothetical protein
MLTGLYALICVRDLIRRKLLPSECVSWRYLWVGIFNARILHWWLICSMAYEAIVNDVAHAEWEEAVPRW